MTLQAFAPTNGAWTDPKTGKLTAAAQIWLRDLWLQAGGSIGIDHGRLIGLLDDDHPQYLNAARGDARYQLLDADLTDIAALSTTAFGRALLTLADAAALTALGNIFTDVLKGLVPASGGGTANFLRADATWAPPPFNAPSAYILAADESTAADTVAIDLTGLEFDLEPNSTYVFRWIGNVSPASATTGCGFQLAVS